MSDHHLELILFANQYFMESKKCNTVEKKQNYYYGGLPLRNRIFRKYVHIQFVRNSASCVRAGTYNTFIFEFKISLPERDHSRSLICLFETTPKVQSSQSCEER
jgi:hypothetical protein